MLFVDSAVAFVKWCRPFTERFGYFSGVLLGLALRRAWWAGHEGEIVQIRVPKFKDRIFLRSKTSDALVFWQVFAENQGYFPVMDYPKLIIDAGANIGLVSACLAIRFPHSRIVALEIDRRNFEMLQRNCAAYPGITPLHLGLWFRQAHLSVANPLAEEWAFHAHEVETEAGGAIPATSVRELMQQLGWPRLSEIGLFVSVKILHNPCHTEES